MNKKDLIKRAHEYADSTFISLLDLHKEDPDGDKSIHNMRSMAYFEGALYAINLFLAECDRKIKKFKESLELRSRHEYEQGGLDILVLISEELKIIAARLKGEGK